MTADSDKKKTVVVGDRLPDKSHSTVVGQFSSHCCALCMHSSTCSSLVAGNYLCFMCGHGIVAPNVCKRICLVVYASIPSQNMCPYTLAPHGISDTQATVHPFRDKKVVPSLNQRAGCQARPCATSIENLTEQNYRFQIFARKRAGLTINIG